ncbi:unnamed protein product [Caenorhabditis brenneri]
MNAPTFPLLQLPLACFQNVLRIMCPIQLVSFSLLSKKCKNFVKSLKLKAEPIAIRVDYSIKVFVVIRGAGRPIFVYNFNNFPKNMHSSNEQEVKKQLFVSKSVSIFFGHLGKIEERYKMIDNQMGVKKWLSHFQSIFHCSKCVRVYFLERSFKFHVDSLRDLFGNLCELQATRHTGSYEFNKLVVQKFHCEQRTLLAPSCFENSRVPDEFLIPNSKFLNVREENNIPVRLSLNDLLMCNSKNIKCDNLVIAPKEVNKFLKLWMKGANPPLETFHFHRISIARDLIDIDVIMKGITYQKMPQHLKRQLPPTFKTRSIHGGLDIHRIDGVKATVWFSTEAVRNRFLMVVWHDYMIQ